MIVFDINCPVEAFAEITPSLVKFNGPAGSAAKEQVRVIPGEKYPFKIIGSRARNRFIHYEIKETMEDDRPGYVVEIENRKTDAGTYNDIITLETDSNINPKLEIRVYGRFYDPAPKKKKEEEKPDQAQDNNDSN